MDSGSLALVTGGAGFIGSHVARALVDRGHRVRILDDLSTGRVENLTDVVDAVDFHEGDIRDQRKCEQAMQGVDVVFHLAALASVARSMADPRPTHDVNVNGTVNLLEAARAAGVRRMVFSSSSSVYGDAPELPKREDAEPLPRSPYAASKLAGEQYVLAYARAGLIEGVALRYFNVFGPRQDPKGPYAAVIPLIMRAALTGTAMRIYGDGGQTRDFTFIENVVQANLLAASVGAARCSGAVVNVGAGDRISLLEAIEIIRRVSGNAIPVMHDDVRPGDVKHSLASLERARDVLGYDPQVDVREGLRRTWEWATQHGQDDLLTAAVR
jgi:UDP-glucose 4-epimerase